MLILWIISAHMLLYTTVGFMGKTSMETAQVDVILAVCEDLFPGILSMAMKKWFIQPTQSVS